LDEESLDQEQFEGGDEDGKPVQRKSQNSGSKTSTDLMKLAKAEKQEKTVRFDNEEEDYEESQVDAYEEMTEE
tara:strand:- start:1961 stop:2179 length:219 start_codon:yes stop_codon:yes gene_type:complete